MKKTLLKLALTGAAFFTYTLAHADLDLKTYTGVDANGAPCEMTVEKIYFENNQPHPLNERVLVSVKMNPMGNASYTLHHPPLVDVKSAGVSFNHDQLLTVLPDAKGASAFVLEMSHEPNQEGPTNFHLIAQEFRSGVKSKLSCHLNK